MEYVLYVVYSGASSMHGVRRTGRVGGWGGGQHPLKSYLVIYAQRSVKLVKILHGFWVAVLERFECTNIYLFLIKRLSLA